MSENDEPVLVYSTFPSLTEAEATGARLVEQRLAACVNIIGGMMSIYRWEGKIERSSEAIMIIKTRSSLASSVIGAVSAGHAYDNPAVLVIPVLDGSPAYCGWLMAETDQAEPAP